MPLAPGRRLGSYEILGALGAGGMGEVYRARDTKLDRTVAVKVLPVSVGQDPDLLARFEREAKAVAALSHPNILAIHDFGTQDGVVYAVMELLDGETLRERITHGALPLKKALDIALQISHGLAAAHDKHIVHRDLKPENIFLCRDGHVKILDFGLAKQAPGAIGGQGSGKDDPTHMATEPGIVLGTVGYMAPEQIRGSAVDARADLFACGAVLYEMLTGTRAFKRDTAAETMTAILKEDPPEPSATRAELPRAIDQVVGHCLEKDPNQRFQSARDLGFNLQSLAQSTGSSATVPVAGPARRRVRESVAWTLVGTLVLVAAFLAWRPAVPAGPTTTVEFTLDDDADLSVSATSQLLGISPDGARVFFSGSQRRQIFVRPLDQRVATPIRGTELGRLLFVSPDGKWLGFSPLVGIKMVSLVDGSVVPVCQTDTIPHDAAMSADGQIVYSMGLTLWTVPATGGIPKQLTALNDGEVAQNVATFLPDGKTLLFTSWRRDGTSIEALTLATRERRVVLPQASGGWYVTTGQLLFVRDGALLSVPFDVGRLTPVGTPVRVIDRVRTDIFGNTRLAVSANGDVVTYAEPETSALVWVTEKGVENPLDLPPRDFEFPRISRDSQRIAFGDGSAVWVHDLKTGRENRVSTELFVYPTTDWNQDNSKLVYMALYDVVVRSSDGSGEPLQLGKGLPVRKTGPSWSPDGKTVAFTAYLGATNADIYVQPADGSAPPRKFVETPGYDAGPQFSPDGRLIAYASSESGRLEVYVTPFPEGGKRWPVSTNGGTHVRWSRQVKGSDAELFYRNGDDMMAVHITLGPTFGPGQIGKPERLFSGKYSYGAGLGLPTYDVAEDGRFLMIKHVDDTSERPRVILHRLAALK